MAVFKTKVPISKLVDKMETKVQRLCICFRGPAIPNGTNKNVVLIHILICIVLIVLSVHTVFIYIFVYKDIC